MKKNFPYLLFFAFLFIGCSNNDDDNSIDVTLQEQYEVATFSVLNLTSSVNIDSPTYEWIMTKNPVNATTDSIVGNTPDLRFIAVNPGAYELTLNVSQGDKKSSKKTIVTVINEAKNYNPYITSIFDFNPAPGMFSNDFYTAGNKKEDVMKIALGRINETSVGYPIDLGGFGGAIVVGFDHTVVNIAGEKDFRVYGVDLPTTPVGNPPAPGLIYVAYDKNGNGKPDEDEWYEIIGSQHTKENTIKNFKITYHKPAADKPLVALGRLWADIEHLYCENNQDEKYYMEKPASASPKKDFYPSWITQNTMVFEGIKLDVNFEPNRPGQTTLWKFTPPEWGYVNAVNPHIDIDWAVDKNGNKANLPGVDFIKIVNCVSEPMGRCTQQSSMATQFSGAADLHILKKYNLRIKTF